MSNSYRIRTQVGVDKSIKVYLDQEFEYLEILSLKILQNQIYTRPCSDYGVVVGRISINNGFGVPNAKVSVFIPLSVEDENNPVISELYPYRSVSDINEDGYRYNLLPYVQQHGGHVPTGTFFDREDVLIDTTLIEVYDKYYKYTARTNESGDYMIFGVPLGNQTVHVDIDLSDIGEFSLLPQDLLRMGRATPSQLAGTRFRSSTNLGELPQIVSVNRTINVEPLWGQEDLCNIGITRSDFDLTDNLNIRIEPTAVFMGSLISSADSTAQKRNCKPRLKQGKLCSMVAGPGEILTIRQTIFQDINGRPGLEVYDLEGGGQVIDDNGTWLVDLPMNLDFVITDEFGQQVLSNDPNQGIPTKAKYRFKVKYNQPPTLREPVKRGYFLVPNIREYGWATPSAADPLKQATGTTAYQTAIKSYAFSIDWNDYVDPQAAINCEDTFYEFQYNKVYTVSQFIDQYRKGTQSNRIIAVKDILDDTCESENNKFPTNDSNMRWDIIFLLFRILSYPLKLITLVLLIVVHILAFFLWLIGPILALIVFIVFGLIILICNLINLIIDGINAVANLLGFSVNNINCPPISELRDLIDKLLNLWRRFTHLTLPNLTYPDCEMCSCKEDSSIIDDPTSDPDIAGAYNDVQNSYFNTILSPYMLQANYKPVVSTNGYVSLTGVQALMAGTSAPTPTTPYSYFRVPNYQINGDQYIFTSSLTQAARINLFNVKGKYFDRYTAIYSPTSGVNQIRVTFNTASNNPATQFHHDNMMVLSCTKDTLTNFPAGQIISFQDFNKSQDPNIRNAVFNQYGNTAITGTPVGTVVTTPNGEYTTSTVTVEYAHPNGTSGNVTTSTPFPYTAPTYIITGKTEDVRYAKFPMDVEYFQVITAMTYSEFSAQTGNAIPNSLNERYLNNYMDFNRIQASNGCWAFNPPFDDFPPFSLKPMECFTDAAEQVLVFLVRGVDPYTTRTPCRYDLSKLFGKNFGNVIIEGDYKLNIPIKGSYKPTNHDAFKNNVFLNADSYAFLPLYYDSYAFKPAISGFAAPAPGQFTAFTSNLPSFYSSLSASPCTPPPPGNSQLNLNFQPTNPIPASGVLSNVVNPDNNCLTQTSDGVRVKSGYINGFTQNWVSGFPFGKFKCNDSQPPPTISNVCDAKVPTDNGTINSPMVYNRGYFDLEKIDGGELFVQPLNTDLANQNVGYCGTYYYRGHLYSPRYTYQLYNYAWGLGASGRRIVMRSDRLPTSSTPVDNAGNSLLLQQNQSFAIFTVSDEGESTFLEGQTIELGGPGANDADQTDSVSSAIFDSFTCAGLVPLSCYDTNSNNEINIKPKPDGCYENGVDGQEIMKNGCYVLVTKIFRSLPKDLQLLAEWYSRLEITFAACRNVWSHLFTNNWINGTLYAFPINNDRFFTEPNSSNPNQPYSLYCRDTVVLHPTNNFYYRSSPYLSTTGEFIGRQPGQNFGNDRNILFPTTIMDLGPKNDFIQELVMSDQYDGYVVNKIPQTTFGDVDEILNLFVISRLINTSFLQQIFSTGAANINSYFTRFKLMVDADYAQSISINSELGVAPFQAENYPADPTGQDPIYFNGANSSDGVFGIFFSSDTQLRDWITPKRTIIVPTGNTTTPCVFNNFGVFSQEVPFYQWDIRTNPAQDSIFGSQVNDWHTTPNVAGNGFLKFKYQSMDRLNSQSRYFRTNNLNTQAYYKGHIYSVTPTSNPLSGVFGLDASTSTWSTNTPPTRVVTVGAPFHFYFGLKKGKTAWDRFAIKWLDFENIDIDG